MSFIVLTYFSGELRHLDLRCALGLPSPSFMEFLMMKLVETSPVLG